MVQWLEDLVHICGLWKGLGSNPTMVTFCFNSCSISNNGFVNII